jgi:hypothetical protein
LGETLALTAGRDELAKYATADTVIKALKFSSLM